MQVMRMIFSILVLLAGGSYGQSLPTLGQLATRGVVPLSLSEIQAFIPGTKVESKSASGANRRWVNEPGGNFIASSVNGGRSGTAKGSWRIDDTGRFCVKIDWHTAVEDWCQFLLKDGDRYRGVASVAEPEAPTYEYRISK